MRREFHQLLHNLPPGMTLRRVATITELGYSSLNNHKSGNETRWMSAKAARAGIDKLRAYLTDPKAGAEIAATECGMVEGVKKGTVQRVLDELVDRRAAILGKMETLREQLGQMEKEVGELETTISVLRRGF